MARIIKSLCLIACLASNAGAWGRGGHMLIARLAVKNLPSDMPAFFRDAIEQLQFLNPEPDSWRDQEEQRLSTALSAGHDPDHIYKFELYAPSELPLDRYSFIEDVQKRGQQVRLVGLLPYRSMELFQRVRVSFRAWRSAKDPAMRKFLEARIVDDAGILGHYIADATQPMHMSINRNGWEQSDNPREFTRDNTFHRRFETDYVNARLTDNDVQPLVQPVRLAERPLQFIYSEMRRSFDRIVPLYEIEKESPFNENNDSLKARRFASEQLADAVSTLRDLWYTAYITSEVKR